MNQISGGFMKFAAVVLMFLSVNCFAASKNVCVLEVGVNSGGVKYRTLACDGAWSSTSELPNVTTDMAITGEINSLMGEGLKVVSCTIKEDYGFNRYNCILARP